MANNDDQQPVMVEIINWDALGKSIIKADFEDAMMRLRAQALMAYFEDRRKRMGEK